MTDGDKIRLHGICRRDLLRKIGRKVGENCIHFIKRDKDSEGKDKKNGEAKNVKKEMKMRTETGEL